MAIRIMLVDDHPIVREGLSSLMRPEADFEVVGEADNGRDAVRLAQKLMPDVVVMDIGMPDLNGVDATRRIRDTAPGVKVIALSMHRERSFVAEILKAGASGYVQKGCTFEELSAALRAVAAGHFYLSPSVTDVMMSALLGETGDGAASLPSVSTTREREVMQLLAEGHSAKQLGAKLGISLKTVYAHRQHIMRKLGVDGTVDLVKIAIGEGLVEPGI